MAKRELKIARGRLKKMEEAQGSTGKMMHQLNNALGGSSHVQSGENGMGDRASKPRGEQPGSKRSRLEDSATTPASVVSDMVARATKRPNLSTPAPAPHQGQASYSLPKKPTFPYVPAPQFPIATQSPAQDGVWQYQVLLSDGAGMMYFKHGSNQIRIANVPADVIDDARNLTANHPFTVSNAKLTSACIERRRRHSGMVCHIDDQAKEFACTTCVKSRTPCVRPIPSGYEVVSIFGRDPPVWI
ncbi:hypothetical protein BCR34DRAFT_555848, partial [Clohesyomyces aquaticus]